MWEFFGVPLAFDTSIASALIQIQHHDASALIQIQHHDASVLIQLQHVAR